MAGFVKVFPDKFDNGFRRTMGINGNWASPEVKSHASTKKKKKICKIQCGSICPSLFTSMWKHMSSTLHINRSRWYG